VIYVGTCGYGYKDWVGPFYPPKTRSREMLPYYASRFGAVEIDSSYYGVPAEGTIAAMLARSPQGFRFSFKAPQAVTHPGDYGTRVHDDGASLRDRLLPVRDAGKFGAVLLQFPNGFKPEAQTKRYLEAVVATFDGLPLVAEFRNRAWQSPETVAMLEDLGVGWCNVDMPAFETLMHPSSDATSKIGYVRFHGRNAAMWWTGDNITRYEYDYAPEELLPWADRIAEIEAQAEQTYVFFNNHAVGNATGNAEMLEEMLVARYGDAADEHVAQPIDAPAVQPGLPGFQA
jgi:uncharacterized protein YecE (DUF72 family)